MPTLLDPPRANSGAPRVDPRYVRAPGRYGDDAFGTEISWLLPAALIAMGGGVCVAVGLLPAATHSNRAVAVKLGAAAA